ncbi:MAG: endonuclease/exonuclease/phosphatase family protein [Gemmatimonadetes bacterium]|nr:endonuclease/exonuclease/phosphatase family protein [Gemmatimonadota bacterium]
MRRLVAAVLALAGCATAPRAGAADAPIRVLSYNIHAGKDAEQRPALERVAALIDSARADVALLQEVDRGTRRSGGVDQVAELERLTGRHAAFAASLEAYDGGQYGIAILSRFPIVEAETVPLPVQPPQSRSGDSHEPRVGLHVTLDAPGGRLHVVTTHLDASGPGTYRRQELVEVLAHLRRHVPAEAPLVFGGDLNADSTSDEAAAVSLALRDAWAECGRGEGGTFPASAPRKRIDYVFFRGGRCLDARVLASQASDHRPLAVTLEFRRRSQ